MMRRAHERVAEHIEERLHGAGWRGYLSREVSVGAKEREGAAARLFNFRKIACDIIGRGQSFGQSPLEGVIPEIYRYAARRLLDCRRRAQDVFADRVNGKNPLSFRRRLQVEPVLRERTHERDRTLVHARELRVEGADDLHLFERPRPEMIPPVFIRLLRGVT